MKLFNAFTLIAVIGYSLFVSAAPAIAYPSRTTICTEVRVELEYAVEEGRLKQQEVEPLLLRCRDGFELP